MIMILSKFGAKVSNQSFNHLFIAHRGALLNSLQKMVHNHAVAEELVQESYLRVSQAINAGNQIVNLRAFLFQTGRNLVIDHLRAQKRRSLISIESMEDFDEVGVALTSDPCEIVTDQQQVLQLADLLQGLTERQRRSFVLNRVHGWSHAQIALELGVSESTIQKDIQMVMKLCISKLRS